MSNGGGEDQDSSFLAEKMLNDARSDALEQNETNWHISLLLMFHILNKKALRRDLFTLVIKPLAETSIEN